MWIIIFLGIAIGFAIIYAGHEAAIKLLTLKINLLVIKVDKLEKLVKASEK